MGKFPDSNLAESLQRVSGVSIDRERGEGSRVTVRGWGPEYNLVTLNGRFMPTSTLGDGASAPSTRSFDFANLASEAIAGVEVYKTGRADIPTGGIGSTINIKTTKPLDALALRLRPLQNWFPIHLVTIMPTSCQHWRVQVWSKSFQLS